MSAPPVPVAAGRAAGVMVGASGLQLLMSIGSMMLLARLLTPADFGVFALALLLLGLVHTLLDFGLWSAAVQSESLSAAQATALFWLNLGLSAAMATLVALSGPLLATVFGQPAMTGVMLFLAAGALVAGLGTMHVALLARQLSYGRIAVGETIAVASGALAAVLSALAGAGYWALVVQQVTILAVRGTIPWLMHPWRPSGPRQVPSEAPVGVRRFFSFGAHVTGTRTLTHIARHADRGLIGYLLGPTALGLYQVALRWTELPGQQLCKPVARVMISSGSRVRRDVHEWRQHYQTAVGAMAAVLLPVLALICVAAPDVVAVLLGPQWSEAVPLLRILAVAAFLDIGRLSTNWLYQVEGRTARQLRWALISLPVTVGAVAVGTHWGVIGVAIGFTLANGLLLAPGVWFCLRDSVLRATDFWLPVARPAWASGAASAALLGVLQVVAIEGSAPVRLTAATVVFALLYAVAWCALPGGYAALHGLLLRVRSLLPHGSARAPHALETEGL